MSEMEALYRMCSRCVMDTTDPLIRFDESGVCNHCIEFETVKRMSWFPGPEGAPRLQALLDAIRRSGVAQEYDCIIGLSGGVDSSYLALRAREWGLRPLVVHVDAGWNSELAVANIESLVRYCGFDLHTHVIDWEEMRDLHLAFLRSGVANQDVPQDHVFFATLYHHAARHRVRYVLSGGNIATEGIFPSSWQGSAMDAINLRAIHRQYGERPLKYYKTISFFEYYLWYPFAVGIRSVRPLNYLPYVKAQAVAELIQVVGFKSYQRKHGESLFTKVFQNYYLPKRFGFDKRKPHLSSLIVSGQLSRNDALAQLAMPLYDLVELDNDLHYFCKKLRISRSEFDDYLGRPIRHHSEFANYGLRFGLLKKVQALAKSITGRGCTRYS